MCPLLQHACASFVKMLTQLLSRALADKAWEAGVGVGLPVRGARREIRAGITGIEKKMNQQAKQDSANISKV